MSMNTSMSRNVMAELLILRKRTATWVLLGIWAILSLMFGYVAPYVTYRGNRGTPGAVSLDNLLPQHIVDNVTGGFPFYGGAIALMLGVLAAGSEYGWGTFKTLYTQRPGRLRIFGAKLLALGITLIPFVLVPFAVGLASGAVIAAIEGVALGLPPAWPLLQAIAAGLFILAVWAAFGVVLAVLSRGTTLAIGIGVLYALAVEGLISAIANQVDLLQPLVKEFVRANAYSLVRALGVDLGSEAGDGPGRFAGPFVSGERAMLVLAVYLLVFVAVSAYNLRRRDVA